MLTNDSRLNGFVLNVDTGEPIEGADVKAFAWSLNSDFSRASRPRPTATANS